MLKRLRLIVFIAVVVITIAVLSLPQNISYQLKMVGNMLFVPLLGLQKSISSIFVKTTEQITPRHVLFNELNRLQEENQMLRIQNQQLNELSRENERLRTLIGLQQRLPWKVRLAEVVARDPANWWKSFTINVGSNANIQTNAPVINQDGLVGVVFSVGPFQSQVAAVGDPNCYISALVVETRDQGIIVPSTSTPIDGNLVELSYLPRNASIQPGHNVITSGLGNIFPKGIKIGVILDVQPAEFGLYLKARVKLAVDISKLEEVWVLQK